MKLVRKVSLLAFITVVGLTGCGEKEESVIKVGATVGPHAQVVEAVAKQAEPAWVKGASDRVFGLCHTKRGA